MLVLACSSAAFACLWDVDTLQMERLRFPAVLEIITGRFVRHSKAYYEWRIVDRKRKLQSKPNDPALIDDLAVAYAKLGRPEEGIPLLEQVLASHPNRYETLSNLGTLLFFAGRLDESKQTIRRALEINPDAHFGRERYQLLLTEYLQQSSKQTDGVMSAADRYQHFSPQGFAHFVLKARFGTEEQFHGYREWPPEHLEELRKASQGVLGMMHFADYQSPILLEALGDLLMHGQLDASATQLAARAYLSAAKGSDDPGTAQKFRKMAEQVLASHIDFHENSDRHFAEFEAKLAGEIDAASAWFARIEAKEKLWIAENRDVDAEFARVYYDSLERTIAHAERMARSEPREIRLTPVQRVIAVAATVLIGGVLAVAISLIAVVRWIRKRRRMTTDPLTTSKTARA
jgi:tetratricopeptide (TPR) repeat protein